MPTLTPTISTDDIRLTSPLFTVAEAARYLRMPQQTLSTWARPRDGAALITALPRHGAHATVPFLGFAEAFVLSAFRKAGVPMQRIRPAVQILREGTGIEHALASRNLYTDGAEVLYDYALDDEDSGLRELFVVRTGQRQFSELVTEYLTRIAYGGDGFAESLELPTFGRAHVVVDPHRAFGQPFLARGGARVEDILDRFYAGEPITLLAADFDASAEEVEEVIRGATRAAASTAA